MRKLRNLPAALVALLALAATSACGGGASPGASAGPDFAGSWSVRSLTAGGRTLTAPPTAHVDFEAGSPGRAEAKGNYGCNGFTAAVAHEAAGRQATALTVEPGASTTMACEHSAFEAEFAKVLRGRLEARRGPGDQLTLRAADGSTVELVLRAPVPDAPLTATQWTVTALLGDGTAASVPAPAAGRAVLRIGPDGAAAGNLGCNRFTAPATVEGDRITFGELTSTRVACTGPEGDLERALTELLGSGPLTWRIRAHTLTLTAPDGRGLTAEAASAAE
ncbi:META domain-containing protein [Streptomyces globosus]|uniref:META domain-containing protein n=1 Tax=Streptomyces globosus TaxID=68209 RepID=A0A344U816_9ACTN|nr:META domain-containing protein [Streptomyces globosus]AXE27037.1 META domain-containing protein [Streptomyces globosus]